MPSDTSDYETSKNVARSANKDKSVAELEPIPGRHCESIEVACPLQSHRYLGWADSLIRECVYQES